MFVFIGAQTFCGYYKINSNKSHKTQPIHRTLSFAKRHINTVVQLSIELRARECKQVHYTWKQKTPIAIRYADMRIFHTHPHTIFYSTSETLIFEMHFTGNFNTNIQATIIYSHRQDQFRSNESRIQNQTPQKKNACYQLQIQNKHIIE